MSSAGNNPDPVSTALAPAGVDGGSFRGAGTAGGRPHTYTDELASEICALLSEGLSLVNICNRNDMPSYRTVMRWLNDQRLSEFQQMYARAREEQGRHEGDRVADMAYAVIVGALDPMKAKVAGDLLKWSAARKAPRKFGDRVQLDATVGGAGTGVIVMPPAIDDEEEWARSDLNGNREIVADSPPGSLGE